MSRLVSISFVALSAGLAFAAWATWPTPADKPFIQAAEVIEISQPVAATPLAFPVDQPVAVTCSPWQVSDVAMEHILEEMILRGWRPPSRGEAVAFSATDASAVDPAAPVPLDRLTRSVSGDAAEETDAVSTQETPVAPNPVAADPLPN